MRPVTGGLVIALLVVTNTRAGAQETSVTITPAGQAVLPPSLTVKILWCGYPPPPPAPPANIFPETRQITVNGVDVTSSFDLQWDQEGCGFQGAVSEEQLWSSTGSITINEQTGPVTVFASVGNYSGGYWAAMETYYPPAPRVGVSVIADQQYVTPLPSENRQERFTLRNTGQALDTFNLSVSGCGGSNQAIPAACSLSALKVGLAAGASITATVSYQAAGTAGKNGMFSLRASSWQASRMGQSEVDTAWVDVTTTAAPTIGVTIAGTAPGANDVVPRSSCITVALTDDAAAECGDLRLTYALPSVRTMGTLRTPTLIYNSQFARPKPLVMADVRLSPSVALPPNVTACIKVSGVNRGCKTWPGSSWVTQGNTRRIVVPGDNGSWGGKVDFTLEVTASNGNQGPYTATGRLYIVHRGSSPYGGGWWLAGLERLLVYSSTELVWIGGDGSVRRYLKSGSYWYAPKYATLDSIGSAGSGYVRRTAEHARVYFNSSGRHDSTVNSLGHVTKLVYNENGNLTTIRVPAAGSTWLDYTLVYSASYLLDSVAAPGGRGTRIFRSSTNRVDSIRGPDGNRVRFTSGTSPNQYVVMARKDRRGNITSFTYDAISNRLTQAVRPLSNTTVLSVAEIAGLATPVPRDSAFTQVDGPRGDVDDRTRFWINGYGAPTRIRNALGHETLVRYSTTWPGLPDSVLTPVRLLTRAYHSTSRGLPDSVKVFNPLGTGANAVTKYIWHPALNRPTSIRTPTTATDWLVDSISYNADGTKAWEQRGTGNSPNRVQFAYTTDKLPHQVILPGPNVITFAYNSLGNLRKEQSPSGFLSFYLGDGVGRDTLVMTPRGTGSDATDSAQVMVKGVRQLTRYDKMDRDTMAITIGPQITLPNGRVVPVDSVKVRSLYDAEGNRFDVTRQFSMNTGSTGGPLYQANASEWEYDALNRIIKQRDAGAGWTELKLDAAGNDTARITPRGYTIRSRYDVLNRVTRRIVPQVTFASSTCSYPAPGNCGLYTFPTIGTANLCVAVDSLFYHYDHAGNLTRADNNWARVGRSYTRSGLVAFEGTSIRRYLPRLGGPCGGGDLHAVAQGSHATVDDFVTGNSGGASYEYDLGGRRTRLTASVPGGCLGTTCVFRYQYNATTGTLDTLVYPGSGGSSLTTRFSYDDQFRLITTTHPGGVTTTRTYDPDGRVPYRTGPATWDTLSFDATGRVLSGKAWHPNGGVWKTLSLGYGGLGALQLVQGAATGMSLEEYKTDALGNRLWVRDVDVIDGVNRTRIATIDPATGQLTAMALDPGPCNPPPNSCHPLWYAYELNQSHDPSGNVDAVWGYDRPTSSSQIYDESRSSYSADERLMYYDRNVGQAFSSTFEEYRYDALGRRVLTRSRKPSGSEGTIERTVWDGDQVLLEARGYAGQYAVSATMEAWAQTSDSTGSTTLGGIVVYVHGPGIDQPVGIYKFIPETATSAYVTPHANWRGEWTYATLSNGSVCVPTTSVCPGMPGFYQTMDGNHDGAVAPNLSVWWGNILTGRTESGLQYLRNRYYDPKTGRFTQQDPIGLAGGLNLYGYAQGDPVNFSDPFGLFDCKNNPTGDACRFIRAVRNDVREGAVFVGAHATGMAVGGLLGRLFGGLRGLLAGSGSGTAASTGSAIRFAQKGISSTFRHGEFAGQSVESVAAGLRSGAISPNQLPINVVIRDGVSYTLNNRSLMALRLAGQEPTVVNNVTGNPVFERLLTERLSELGGQVSATFVPAIR